ncbi:hypothetical protein [Aestuariimicrobium ganziense]|uniref:hypothetical protein n=1 Tax=Aestuariimicrobium ganziense TaxID=2773677 RepID=UPI0019418D2C|nr:hypothetical protein [Aestuariimicrobium ganziense]
MFGWRRSPDSESARKSFIPDGLPVLSRGSHRDPRHGACFMEMASYLAGERWSDHPSCTHPGVAALARMVNDELDDEHRQHITALIPDVVGLNPTHYAVMPTLVRCVALTGLPVASEENQNLMALAALNAEAHLAGEANPRPDLVSARTKFALDQVPSSRDWAWRHLAELGPRKKPMDAKAIFRFFQVAVKAVDQACTRDPQSYLVAMLTSAVREVQALQGPAGRSSAPVEPVVVSVTGVELLDRDSLNA